MIETIVRDYLTERLDVPVALEVPERPPGSYVVIEKTGSGEANGLCTATLAIQSVHRSLYGAARLNERVKAAMRGIRDSETNVFRCEPDSDYNFTDTTTKERRYQAVVDLYYIDGPDEGDE